MSTTKGSTKKKTLKEFIGMPVTHDLKQRIKRLAARAGKEHTVKAREILERGVTEEEQHEAAAAK